MKSGPHLHQQFQRENKREKAAAVSTRKVSLTSYAPPVATPLPTVCGRHVIRCHPPTAKPAAIGRERAGEAAGGCLFKSKSTRYYCTGATRCKSSQYALVYAPAMMWLPDAYVVVCPPCHRLHVQPLTPLHHRTDDSAPGAFGLQKRLQLNCNASSVAVGSGRDSDSCHACSGWAVLDSPPDDIDSVAEARGGTVWSGSGSGHCRWGAGWDDGRTFAGSTRAQGLNLRIARWPRRAVGVAAGQGRVLSRRQLLQGVPADVSHRTRAL